GILEKCARVRAGDSAAADQANFYDTISRFHGGKLLPSGGACKSGDAFVYFAAMNPQEIAAKLQDRFGEKIVAAFLDDKHPRVHVNAPDWREIAQHLHDDRTLLLDWLACLSGVDYVADGKMSCVYDLWSFEHRHIFAVKVFTPRD